MRLIVNFLFVIILFSTATISFGQLDLSGVMKNEATDEPLPYATIAVLNPQDSTIINGTVTDDLGVFSIKAKEGVVLLKLSYISFKDRYISREISESTDLGDLFLKIDEGQLDAVVVEGTKSETQFYLDKKVFIVGQDLTAVGTNAVDVLSNVPSVSTDVDGTVSLRGSEGVQILINGKQSGLVGLGDGNALRNIPANLIEKVEVITNPSARYDAEGQVGIINIILKKQQKAGVNGSIDLNGGNPDSYGAGINMNYRKNKINLFTNLGYRYRLSPGEGLAEYDYFTPVNDIYSQENDREMERKGKGGNAALGLEYFFTEKQSLTGSFRYSKGDDDNQSTITYNDFGAASQLLQQLQRIDAETENEKDLAYTIQYNYDLDSLGKKITADIRYELTDELELNDFSEDILFGENYTPVSQIARNNEGQDEYLFQIDFINPISKAQNLEFGAKSTLRDINTDFEVKQLVGNQYEILESQSNQFVYEEDIYALYAQYGDERGKIGYQLGLRGEYSDINTLLINTNEENPREYFQLFPSAFFTYKTNGDDAVQLSFSRRIRRPGFWHLNPFLSYTDPRRLFAGNPNLNPEFTNSFELGYLKELDKTTINSSVYFRKTTDVISRITETVSADTIRIVPQNLNQRDDMGFEFIVNSDITKWWTADLNLNVFRFQEDGSNLGSQFEANGTSWFARASSRLKLPGDVSGQMRFFYRGPMNTTQGKRQSMNSLDLGFGKDFLNDKATVTANIRDLFNARRYRGETVTDSFFSYSVFQRQPRSFNLAFNYRINQNNKKRRNQQEGGRDFEGGDDGGF